MANTIIVMPILTDALRQTYLNALGLLDREPTAWQRGEG